MVYLKSGTPLSVGQIVQGGAAADDGRLIEGDEVGNLRAWKKREGLVWRMETSSG